MVIAFIIMLLVWCIPMMLYIIWKRGDWYLFFFPMCISILICAVLSLASDVLSIGFTIIIAIYFVYSCTNRKARQIRNEIKNQREDVYKEYKRDEVDNQVRFKDYLLPSGNKVEYIDFNTKTIYLLRPYAENIDKKYEKQIQKYLKELRMVFGGEWSCVIDTY